MVDFKKKLGKKRIEKKTNPIEIYDSLDRRSETGPLRPAQEYILKEWYTKRKADNNLIIKLHTGEGKTLIGLLILQSKINSENSPSLYICPNKYLAQQVMLEAKKFGIPYCIIDIDNTLPDDFIDGKKILITYVQKVFNGKTIFGINNNSTDVGNVIMDDSHACIDSIKDTFTITFDSEHEIYKYFITAFEDEIKSQGEGSFLEIKDGDYETMLPISYWSWIERKFEILEKLTEYRDELELVFCWPFVKDNIENFQAFISGNKLEFSPYHVPIHHFGSFHNAAHRILMSATTQDDSFFIKGLGFNVEAVKNPLKNPVQKWSGEKMILIPSLIHDSLDRETIVNMFAKQNEKLRFGIVFLTNSFRKADQHKQIGSIVAKSEDIYKHVQSLKKGRFGTPVVFANRYDGIDLPDESCRILIIDSKPFFNSLTDRYEENCRVTSDLINIKIAQKIEQGLGRSVRGEKDYSAIIITGDDLVRFIKSSKTNKYFSEQTRKQVDIGLEIAKMADEDLKEGKEPRKVLLGLLNQILKRDDGWKAFYIEEMNDLETETNSTNIYDILAIEHKAEEAYYLKDYETAQTNLQDLIDNKLNDKFEKGWYLQILARYSYQLSKSTGNTVQKSAFLKNRQLLKPKEGISYKKLEYINENRIHRIKDWLKKHTSYQDIMIAVDGILSELTFGVDSNKFEKALQETGEMLGFLSERPDKEYKKGPDNLWCGVDDHYFLFECKSEVSDERSEIKKQEAGQMNSHCGWFESEYGEDASVTRILVIHTKTLSYNANFTHKVKILRKGKLRTLKTNIKSFFKEFKNYKIREIGDEKIQEFLNTHKLDIESLKKDYSEKYYQRN
ncbi:MAG: DEAD/DEAH box helicase family protein [Bacteroidales bacterium]|nr:DEAD/DEAH box helicase family protein [Bacteroidales bacterium]